MKLSTSLPGVAARVAAVAASSMTAVACGGGSVIPTPHTALLDQTYQPAAVRDAVARSITHRKLDPQGETDGRVTVTERHHGCLLSIDYAPAQVIVTASAPLAATPPSAATEGTPPAAAKVNQRCDVLAAQLAKAVADEVQAPARAAAKEIRDQRNAEVNVARAQAFSQAASLAREQLAQQQGAAADPGGDQAPDPGGDQGGDQGADPAAVQTGPAPAGGTTVINNVAVTNTTYRVRGGGGPQPGGGVQMKRNLCCTGGQAFVCPSVEAYASACVNKRAPLAKVCRAEAAQRQFCPH